MSSYLDLEGLGVYHDKNKEYIDGKIPTKTSDLTNDSGFVTESALNAKAPLASPTLTGTPKAPTATVGTNTTQIATTAFVQTAVANLVDGAPETLNTLKEVSDALTEHEEVADALNDAIGKKVDKVDGKGLSTNDYTTTEKTKLSGIATGAEVNQNAFSNIKVGTTTISADAKTDTLELVGSNVTITPDATNDKVTIGITKANVTSALGYTPPATNTTYGVATSSALGLVKSGTDITVDSSGNVSVNDDSHNHVIANIDGLQTALDGKAVKKILASENLNDVKTAGFYEAAGGNTVTNKPSGIEHFGLYVIHRASGEYYTQILIGNDKKQYRRHCENGTWSAWSEDKLTDTNTTYSNFVKSGSGAKAGLVPAPSTTAGTTKYLREDGTWTVPPNTNTTYSVVTASANGLVPMFDTSDGTIDSSSTDWVLTNNNGSIGWYKLPANAFNNTTYSAATTSANGLMSTTDKTKLEATNMAYGTCSTAAATAAKVITISGNTNWKLSAGSMITVKFSATNTASNPTFNVNSTGAKSVWYNTAVITTSNLGYAGTANRPMNFVYDGTQYVFVGWSLDNNTTYSNASLGQGYGTCATAAATVAKVVTLSSYSLTTGGIVSIKFTNAVPASATMNINGKGAKAIYYRGSAITAGVINAGDMATFIYNGSQYHLIAIDSEMSSGGGTTIYKQTSEPTVSDTAVWIPI